MNEYEPDEKTLALIEQKFHQMQMIEHQIRGIIDLVLAQQNLEGSWLYDREGRKLIRQEPRPVTQAA